MIRSILVSNVFLVASFGLTQLAWSGQAAPPRMISPTVHFVEAISLHADTASTIDSAGKKTSSNATGNHARYTLVANPMLGSRRPRINSTIANRDRQSPAVGEAPAPAEAATPNDTDSVNTRSESTWHVWNSLRRIPSGTRHVRIVFHIEPYTTGQPAVGTFWFYTAKPVLENGKVKFRLELDEFYSELQLNPLQQQGPLRGMTLSRNVQAHDANGAPSPGGTRRLFFLSGAISNQGANIKDRAVRLTTSLIKPGASVSAVAPPANGVVETSSISSDCIDYPDDAYYDEEEYDGPPYTYPDPSTYPYEGEDYDYDYDEED